MIRIRIDVASAGQPSVRAAHPLLLEQESNLTLTRLDQIFVGSCNLRRLTLLSVEACLGRRKVQIALETCLRPRGVVRVNVNLLLHRGAQDFRHLVIPQALQLHVAVIGHQEVSFDLQTVVRGVFVKILVR